MSTESASDLASDDGVTPIVTPSLVDLCHASLRSSIVRGRLEMGDRINELQLSKDLGVSRGTLRLACRKLVQEGLLEERPRQGVFVRAFSPRDVIDIYNIRVGIETVAARLAVRRGPDVRAIESRLDALRTAADEDDLHTIFSTEYAFHEEICRQSGNAQLMDVYRTLHDRIRIALSVDNRDNEDMRALAARHEPILEAIRRGDEDEVAFAVHAHIVGHIDEVLIRLGADPSELLQPSSDRFGE